MSQNLPISQSRLQNFIQVVIAADVMIDFRKKVPSIEWKFKTLVVDDGQKFMFLFIIQGILYFTNKMLICKWKGKKKNVKFVRKLTWMQRWPRLEPYVQLNTIIMLIKHIKLFVYWTTIFFTRSILTWQICNLARWVERTRTLLYALPGEKLQNHRTADVNENHRTRCTEPRTL